jgi:hypothetical protein
MGTRPCQRTNMDFSFDIAKHAQVLWNQLLSRKTMMGSSLVLMLMLLSPLVLLLSLSLPMLVLVFILLLLVELVCFGHWALSLPLSHSATQPVATAAAARPPPDADSTQDKPTFAVASAGIPDVAHTSVSTPPAVATTVAADDAHASVYALPSVATDNATNATAAFSIHNNENDWDLALVPRAIGNTADTGATGATCQNSHHVDLCGLQVFDLLASYDSESDASEFDECDGVDWGIVKHWELINYRVSLCWNLFLFGFWTFCRPSTKSQGVA